MKKFSVFPVCIILMALGMVLISCDDGSNGGSSSSVPTVQDLQGRWVNEQALEQGWREYYAEFEGNRLFIRIVDPNGNTTNTPGSFSISDTAIIHNVDGYMSFSMPYVFNGNQLWMSNIMGQDSSNFVKQ